MPHQVGKIEFTAIEYTTLSGGRGYGGSMGGSAGAVLNDGMLFVNSGYGIYFHMPGNVLLAFGLAETVVPVSVSP